MYTCRRCLCKNCKCDNCNCKNKRTFVTSKETFILWAIGGALKRDICEKLSKKYQLSLLSFDAVNDREKNEENSNQVGISKLKDAIQLKQGETTAVGYIIESSMNYEVLTQFEKTVGPIKAVLYFKTTDKIIKNEILEQLKQRRIPKKKVNENLVASQENVKKVEITNMDEVENEISQILKKCMRKTETIQEKAFKELNKFNENLDKIQATYKENFKVIKGKVDVEDSFFNNAVIFLDDLLPKPKELEIVADKKKSKNLK